MPTTARAQVNQRRAGLAQVSQTAKSLFKSLKIEQRVLDTSAGKQLSWAATYV
jgi:hypothetical protein